MRVHDRVSLGVVAILFLRAVPSSTVVASQTPRDRSAWALGKHSSGSLSGSRLGPLIGGFLTQHASWRWVFYVNLPVGALALLDLVLEQAHA